MKIVESARELEIINDVDVCVVGGSCTGVFAAIRAAQMGMSTAIIEKQNSFGGAAASGLVHIWHSIYDVGGSRQIIGGLTSEVIDLLKRRCAVIVDEGSPGSAYRMNTEELKIELDLLIKQYKITPYLHTAFCSTVIEDKKIKAVIIENKNGRSAVSAKFFIDATGDGDLCRRIGIEAYLSENMQPPSMCAKILGAHNPLTDKLISEHGHEFGLSKDWGWRDRIPNIDDIFMHAENHVFGVNCANAEQLTYSEMEGRAQVRAVMDVLRKYMPGGEKITLLSLPSYIGIRETYHIKSLHQVKNDELLYGVKYEDAIGNGSYRVDIHHDVGAGITFKYLDGTSMVIPEVGKPSQSGRWRDATDTNPTYYQIPYRAILPCTNIDNILFAGRMVDAQAEAFSALRVMVNTNQMGEAAGVAAALAVKENQSAKNIDVKKLRNHLSELGAIIL